MMHHFKLLFIYFFFISTGESSRLLTHTLTKLSNYYFASTSWM